MADAQPAIAHENSGAAAGPLQQDPSDSEVLSQIGNFNEEEQSLLDEAYQSVTAQGFMPDEPMPADTYTSIEEISFAIADTLIDVYREEYPGKPHLHPIEWYCYPFNF